MAQSCPKTCVGCGVRELGGFCSLGDEALLRLSDIGAGLRVKRGERIFLEGFPCDHVFVVCSGQVKVTLANKNGRVLILRIATPGDVLGLAATLQNVLYESSATAIEESELKALSRNEFNAFMSEFAQVAKNSARVVAASYSSAILSARRLALSGSAAGKLASVLLDWAERASHNSDEMCFIMPLTHEELGNMAGISRETASRLMGQFRQQSWITQKNDSLCIGNAKALQALFS